MWEVKVNCVGRAAKVGHHNRISILVSSVCQSSRDNYVDFMENFGPLIVIGKYETRIRR